MSKSLESEIRDVLKESHGQRHRINEAKKKPVTKKELAKDLELIAKAVKEALESGEDIDDIEEQVILGIDAIADMLDEARMKE